MHFEGEFHLQGRPEEIIDRFTDIERMARCVPGATLEGRDPDGGYTGTIVVSFGPKRIKFRGKVFCEFDIPGHTGLLRGRGVADMRAARFEVRTTFSVHEDVNSDPEQPVSTVKIRSAADLHGVLAALASTGGTAVGNVLMQEFARNLEREFAQERGFTEAQGDQVEAISVQRVVWSAVKKKASRVWPGGSNSPRKTGGSR